MLLQVTPEPCQQLRGIDEAEHDKSLISNPKNLKPLTGGKDGVMLSHQCYGIMRIDFR